MEKRYYNKLVELKEKNQLSDFNELSKDDLVMLSWYEDIPESSISELFNIPQMEVKNRLKKWNINPIDMIDYTLGSEWFTDDTLRIIGYDCNELEQIKSRDELKNIIEKIENLSDYEFELFKQYFTKSYTVDLLLDNIKAETIRRKFKDYMKQKQNFN